MKLKFLTWLGAFLLTSLVSLSAWAALGDTFTCSMTTPVYAPAAAYSPFATVVNQTAVSFTVSCSRNFKGDATLSYRVSVNNGLNNGGVNQNKAVNTPTTSNLPYDLYTTASTGCVTLWEIPNYLTGAITWIKNDQALISATPNTFNLCIPTGSTGVLADSYRDTLTFTITNSVTGIPTVTATPVQSIFIIAVNKECALTASPVNIDFGTYNSLSNIALNANTTFVTRCTNQGAYTMSLEGTSTGNNTNPVNGVLAGLNYSLGITGPAAGSGSSVGGATVSRAGIGAGQTYYINAYMPGGQAGSCASGCGTSVSSPSHTLTITY